MQNIRFIFFLIFLFSPAIFAQEINKENAKVITKKESPKTISSNEETDIEETDIEKTKTDEKIELPSIDALYKSTESETPESLEKQSEEEPPKETMSKEQKELMFSIGRMLKKARHETKAMITEYRKSKFQNHEMKTVKMLDLKTRFHDPNWKLAIQAFEKNKCASAKKYARKVVKNTPNILKDPEYELAYATFEMCAGKREIAIQTFKRLAQNKDAVGAAARVMLGKNRLSPDGKTTLSIQKQIQALSKSTTPAEHQTNLIALTKLQQTIRGRPNRRRARLVHAELLAKMGKKEAAKHMYLDLLRDTFGSRFNARVEKKIRAFETSNKMRVLSYADSIDLMRSYIRRGKYADAKQVSIQTAKRQKLSANEIRGWMFYRQALEAERRRKRETASVLFSKAEKLIKNKEVRPRLYFGWARALRRINQDKKAIKLYDRLCKEYSKHHLCDNALYEAGRLEQYAKNHKSSIARFTKIVNTQHSEYVADALWRRGFDYYLLNQYEKARKDFVRIKSEFSHRRDASELSLGLKANYWIGVTLHKEGKKSEAITQYKHTLKKGPLTWYGRLAAARLQQLGFGSINAGKPEKISAGEMQHFDNLQIPSSSSLEPIALWIRLGFYRTAQKWTSSLARSSAASQGTIPLLSALNLYYGRPDLAHWNMKKYISEEGPALSSARQWTVAFPNPYAKEIKKYGKKAGVSQHLVQAIIRQESGFRPKVKSYAGAVGLMQLMPGTARYVAKAFGKDAKYTRAQLTTVNTNIHLGSEYIRLHTAFANDRIPLALAGYNAGPAPLKSWMKRYGDRELDAFVESITYREARGYVRKVYTSYIVYSALYGDTLPVLNLQLPSELRKWGVIPQPLISFHEFNQRKARRFAMRIQNHGSLLTPLF